MSVPAEPARPQEPVLEEGLTALRGSETLTMLGITIDDLQRARDDADLLETLRISHELLVMLREKGVLDTFLLLPKDEQANFIRWIGATDGRDLRRDRAETFISALEESPLATARLDG